MLASYTACLPPGHRENRHVKSIVNTRWGLVAATPHHFMFRGGKFAVNTLKQRVNGPKSQYVTHAGAVVHHYAVKSQQDFSQKMERGSGMSNNKVGQRARARVWGVVAALPLLLLRGPAALRGPRGDRGPPASRAWPSGGWWRRRPRTSAARWGAAAARGARWRAAEEASS